MKKSRKIMLILLIVLLLLLALEIVLRPRIFRNSLASALYSLKRYEDAGKLFERNQAGDDATASANLAKSLYKEDRLTAAEESAKRANELDPEPAGPYYDRGNIAFKEQDYQKAVDLFSEALLRAPDDEDIKANLELAIKKLEENPPPPQPESQDQDQEQQAEEDYRNILDALDNLEAQERQKQAQKSPPKTENWW